MFTADILLLLLVSRSIQVFDNIVILVTSVTVICQTNLLENANQNLNTDKIFYININFYQ